MPLPTEATWGGCEAASASVWRVSSGGVAASTGALSSPRRGSAALAASAGAVAVTAADAAPAGTDVEAAWARAEEDLAALAALGSGAFSAAVAASLAEN